MSTDPSLVTLSIVAHRSAKVEAFPATLRAIKRLCKLSHLSIHCRMEEGQAFGIEARIGFLNERYDMTYVKRKVVKELGADFDLRWRD